MDNIRFRLKDEISLGRYEHTLRICKVALEIADIMEYEDKDKVIKGALLHDCAKYPSKEVLLEKSKIYGLDDHIYYKKNIQLLHGPLGSVVAKKEYGIEDGEVLDAIKYHTTGRENMTDLEKIIFLADYIDPRREFKGLDNVRSLVYSGEIDEAVLATLNQNIKYVISIDKYLAIDTIKARNHIIINIHN